MGGPRLGHCRARGCSGSSRGGLSKPRRGCLFAAPKAQSVQFLRPSHFPHQPDSSVLPCAPVGHRAPAPGEPPARAAFLPLLPKFYVSLRAPSEKSCSQAPGEPELGAAFQPPLSPHIPR